MMVAEALAGMGEWFSKLEAFFGRKVGVFQQNRMVWSVQVFVLDRFETVCHLTFMNLSSGRSSGKQPELIKVPDQDAEKRFDEKIHRIYKANGGRLAPLFERLEQEYARAESEKAEWDVFESLRKR